MSGDRGVMARSHSARTSSIFHLGSAFLVLALWASVPPSAWGAEPGSSQKTPLTPADVKQLFVPADQPNAWPEGNWEVISAREYRELLEGLRPKPAVPEEATIQNARYQAVFTGENLVRGRLAFQIRQSGAQRLLSLEPLNLAVTSLSWSGSERSRPAAWGSTPGGRTLLVLPRLRSPRTEDSSPGLELQGKWSASGRRLSERVDFDLEFAPAVVTELELYLPERWGLQSSAGQVEGPLPIPESAGIPLKEDSALRLWRVALGSETACRVSVSRQKPETAARPLLLAESDTTYLVRERELQIESRYELEAVFAPVTQVVFDVPRTIEIYGVSYGGDVNVSWRTKTLANHKQVILDFPDPLLGKSRPIRIQGLARAQANRAWPLPKVTCPDASLLRGELHLTVDAPLELRSYELSGFRQTAISAQANQRETLTFAQIAPDRSASLTAYIGTPAFSVSTQSVSYLTAATEEWQMRTELTWNAQSGSRYIVTCEVLPGWEILDVRRSGESSLPVISDWRLTRRGDRLTIEFLEALTPMQSKRVQILARRVPLTSDQTMTLAAVKPVLARTVEQFLAVVSDKGDILAADTGAGITPWKANNYPAFVQNSSLLPMFNSPDAVRDLELFYSKSPEPEGALTLRRSAPPYDATVNVLVNLANHQVHETLIFTINPLEMPLDRLALLAPAFGAGWSWEISSGDSPSEPIDPPVSAGDQASDPEARSIPWEIRLPSSQSERFQIVANRHVEFAPLYEVGLPHFPAARDFQGTVEVSAPGGTLLDVESRFTEEDRLSEPRKAPQTEILRRWRYQSPEATFSVGHLPQDAASPGLLGRLTLLSVINGYSHSNIHRAEYELESSPEHIGFPFKLPEAARLIEVRLNGDPVEASRSEEGYFLHYLPPGQKNSVELCYQTNWEASGLTSTLGVPIPSTGVTLLGFAWRFAVSPNLSLSGPPSGLALERSGPAAHWTTRLFGPVGQGTGDNFFRPWNGEDWKSLVNSRPLEQAGGGTETGGDFFPAGWTIHEARAPRPADNLQLAIWNRDLVNPLVWVLFLLSLTFGLAFRLWGKSRLRPLGWAWLLLNAAGAGLLPLPWSILCGGSIAGTVVALLFPRRFLKRSQPATEEMPIGSTATFHHHAPTSAIILAALGLFAADSGPIRSLFGQEIPPAPEVLAEKAIDVGDFNVLVPVDNPRNPQTAPEILYIDRDLLKRLRQAQPAPEREEDYLISSAKYDLDVSPSGAVDLTADFEIVLLHSDRTVSIALPIENAFLGGPGSCLVDGKPHAVLSKPDFAGYLLELAPESTGGPAVADKADDNLTIAVRRVQLRLHGGAAAGPGGGRFQFMIPAVPASELKASLPEMYASVQLLGMQGAILSRSPGRSLSGTVGASRKLELVWSQKPNGLARPVKRPASVSALATIQPFWIEWQIRVKDQPAMGTPSAFLTLPRNTLVKTVKADRLESFRTRQEAGGTRLFLEFPEPVTSEFSVEISAITPRNLPGTMDAGEVRLPALDLFAGLAEPPETEYHLGVNCTPELALGPPAAGAEAAGDILVIPPERFVSAYRMSASETIAIRTPQLAWKIVNPTELVLPIQPRMPSKQVWLNQEGQLTEREILWSITAEVETSGAKAFRHVFHVPEAFLVDTVSVFEDETERLVRWTKAGTRLELVLSDGTTGIQNVNITGWLPFLPREGNRANLPMVQVEDAEVVDSRLRLFQSRLVDHLVKVEGIQDLPAIEEEGAFLGTNGVYLLAGVRLTEPERVLAIEVGGEIPEPRLDKAVVIERAGDSQIRVTTLLHVLEETRQSLQIRLPATMTGEFRVDSPEEPGRVVPYETLTNADNSLDLVFHSSSQDRPGTLRIEAYTDLQAGERGDVFQIPVVEGRVENALLMISPEFSIQPADQADRPETLSVEEVAPWFQETPVFRARSSEFSLFRPPGGAWRLSPAKLQQNGPDRQFAVRTMVWLNEADAILGRSFLEFPADSVQSLAWSWPAGTSLEGALLDGRELSPAIDEENQSLLLLLPARTEIKPASLHRTLELYWSRKLASPIPRFGLLEVAIPRPQDVPIDEAQLSLIPAPHARLIPQEGFGPAENSDPAEVDSLTGRLPAEGSVWAVSLWTMDSRTERALLVGLILLVLAGIAHWGLRLNSGEWLNTHYAVALAALGLLWWLCFKASAVGFLILILAPVFALLSRARPESPPQFDSEG